MRKKLFLVILVVLMVGLTLPLFSAGAKEKGQKKIVFMYPHDADSPMTVWYQNNVRLYQEANPDVKIDVISSSTGDEYLTQVTTKLASGDPIDLMQGWTLARMEPFAKSGRLRDLNEVFAKDPEFRNFLQDDPLEATTFDGGVYGVPLELAVEAIFYNKAIFKKAGVDVPKNYDEFLKLFPAIRNAGYIPIALGNSEPWIGSIPYMMIVERIGGLEVYEKTVMDGVGKWTDSAFIDAGRELQKWMQMGAFEPYVNGIPAVEGVARFSNGEAAMMFMGSWSMPSFYEDLGDDLGVFNLPTMSGGKGSDNHWIIVPNQALSLGANTAYPEVAEDFLKFMLSEERQKELAKSGLIVTTKVKLSPTEVNPVQATIVNFLGEATGAMYPWDVPMGNELGAELNNATMNLYDGADPVKVFNDFQRLSDIIRN